MWWGVVVEMSWENLKCDLTSDGNKFALKLTSSAALAVGDSAVDDAAAGLGGGGAGECSFTSMPKLSKENSFALSGKKERLLQLIQNMKVSWLSLSRRRSLDAREFPERLKL